MNDFEYTQITVVTPTIGEPTLFKLIDSLEKQGVPYNHLLIWDNYNIDTIDPRLKDCPTATIENKEIKRVSCRYNVFIPWSLSGTIAKGSALRSIGMMMSKTPYVTFADSDVYYETNHLKTMLEAIQGHSWAYCRRKIWKDDKTYIGEDNFESVGDGGIFDYKLVDNSSMIFERRLGTSAAVLFRETQDYNDDRLFYSFLKQHGGPPGLTNLHTVNQICPSRLVPFFEKHCTKPS